MAAVKQKTWEVSYHGYVYVKGTTAVIPGLAKVKEAYKLLKKPKVARQLHPLFARGFDTKLNMIVRESLIVDCCWSWMNDFGDAVWSDGKVNASKHRKRGGFMIGIYIYDGQPT